ncbi:hypothetical protein SAMN05216466_10856 [Paraburkholderia phenazinium]|uniref:Uncharacterized protein n=1 Tax=Paraburkholderia phenazinium TaxID=60549 RepID=A0A1G8ASN0_9BURK|nr:hypothetical protein SAMN05216466_10856 [Paraburkholderia phenazinium]
MKAEQDQTIGNARKTARFVRSMKYPLHNAPQHRCRRFPEWRVYLREWPGNLRENG